MVVYKNTVNPYDLLYEGFPMEFYVDGRYIALSYGVAFVGALAAIEVLLRRTTENGMVNW